VALADLLRREPRKQVTGTGYEAKPAIEAEPQSYTEIGSQYRSPLRDPLPEFVSRNIQIQTYKKMARTDASVRSSLRAGKAPVLGADFFFEPFDDSEEAMVAAEFAEFNILKAGNVPWIKTLSEILTMLDNGFSVFEPVYEPREWAPKLARPTSNRKVYTTLRKLPIRPAATIERFAYDENGGPLGAWQNVVVGPGKDKAGGGTSKRVFIPIEKLIVFTFEGEGSNLEGESILRSAYPHWFYKTTLYKIDAIQKERHGIGVPDIEIAPGASDEDVELAHKMGRNLRTNEFSYIVRPPSLKVGFAEIKGNLVNALESANHHDNMIMKNILVQFLNLGIEGSGGGRAVGATAFDMFLKSMSFLANYVCDCFNLYLIPRLISYNFQTDKFPRMSVSNIGETRDDQAWSSAVANLLDSAGITPDLPLENHLRKKMDLPMRTEARPEPVDDSNGKVRTDNIPKPTDRAA
jgi:hypothetical protein